MTNKEPITKEIVVKALREYYRVMWNETAQNMLANSDDPMWDIACALEQAGY